jgi:hypothetical protein
MGIAVFPPSGRSRPLAAAQHVVRGVVWSGMLASGVQVQVQVQVRAGSWHRL